MPSNPVSKTVLPGIKEGLSGTTIGGYNIGIGGYINGTRRDAAVEAFQYITSKEIQKKFIMERGLFSGILDLYEDEEVCEVIDCKFFKSFQPIARPTNLTNNYDRYSEMYRNIIYEYLYGNKDINKVLHNIENILKIYSISVNPKESLVGFFFFIIISLIALCMAISALFLFTNKYKEELKFITFELWLMIIIGNIIILLSGLLEYGEPSSKQCKCKIILLSIGCSLNIIPLLFKIVQDYPKKNKYGNWIINNKLLYLLISIILNAISILLFYFISDIDVFENNINKGKNYRYCQLNGFSNYLLLFILFLFNLISSVIISYISFLISNISYLIHETKLFMISIYTNIFGFCLLFLTNFIQFNNYIIDFLIHLFIFGYMSISNYVILYINGFLRKKLEIQADFTEEYNNQEKRNSSKQNDDINKKKSNHASYCKKNFFIESVHSNKSQHINENLSFANNSNGNPDRSTDTLNN